MIKTKTKIKLSILCFAFLGLVFAGFNMIPGVNAASSNCLDNNRNSKVTKCNYPAEWGSYKDYDTVKISSGQMSLVANIPLREGYYAQGAAYAGKYIIYTEIKLHDNSDDSSNKIYVRNLATGEAVSMSAKGLGHLHSIYYDFNNNRFYVRGKRDTTAKDACIQIKEKSSGLALKELELGSCNMAKPVADYRDGLVYQGEGLIYGDGPFSGYTAVAYWDAGTYKGKNGNEYYGFSSQKYHYVRDSNAVIIHDKAGNIVKTIYIPRSVLTGELEGVSSDKDGNLYLNFGVGNNTNSVRVMIYKISAETFAPKKAEEKEQEKAAENPVEGKPEPELESEEAPEEAVDEPVVVDENGGLENSTNNTVVETKPIQWVQPTRETNQAQQSHQSQQQTQQDQQDQQNQQGQQNQQNQQSQPTQTTQENTVNNINNNASISQDFCGDLNVPEEVKRAAGCIIDNNTPDISMVVTNIIKGFIGVVGMVCLIMIVYGGAKYMTSAGNPDKIKSAKNTILYAVIGVVIAVLSFAIVNFVIGIIK